VPEGAPVPVWTLKKRKSLSRTWIRNYDHTITLHLLQLKINTDYNFVTKEIGEYTTLCEREMSADRSCRSEVQIRYSWEERMKGDLFLEAARRSLGSYLSNPFYN
jgi:hypothetical protein